MKYFWNFPGIFHITKQLYFCCDGFFFEYSILCIFIFHGIFRGIHIPKTKKKICDAGRKVLPSLLGGEL